MWASSGTAAAKAGGSPAARAPASVDSTAPDHELGGDRRRRGARPLAAAAVDRPREALADLGAPAQGGAARHVDLDQQAAGDERALLGEAGELVEPGPQPGRQPLAAAGDVEDPRRRAARPRPRRPRRSSRLCWRSGGRTGRGCRRSGRSRPGPRPGGSPSPRRPRASPRGCLADLLGLPLAALVESGPVRRAACPTSIRRCRPPAIRWKTIVLLIRNRNLAFDTRSSAGLSFSSGSLPDHLMPAPSGRARLSQGGPRGAPARSRARRRHRGLAPRGYQATTVDQIVAARADRRRQLLRAVRRQGGLLPARSTTGSSPSRGAGPRGGRRRAPLGGPVEAGLRALLELAAAEPDRARIVIVEASTAAAGGGALRGERARAGRLIREGRRALSRREAPPASFERAAVAGMAWTLHQRLAAGEPVGVDGAAARDGGVFSRRTG